MNPFYFGSSERPLFGIYHPPKGTARRQAVLICPPMGQEYMRTHRALRQLALQLGKAGFAALRFDYSGTGDSSGLDTDASLGQWLSDIGTAADELKDTASVPAISIVGIRLGASLGFLASRERRDVDSVVLWDPVVHGRHFVQEVLTLDGHAEPGGGTAEATESIGFGGFALTPEFRRELAAIDLGAVAHHSSKRLLLVASAERTEYQEFTGHLATLPTPSIYRHIPSGGDWADAERLGAALLPQAIIQGIVECLS